MNTKELRIMPAAELNSKLLELRKELMKENAQIAVGSVPKNPGNVRLIKKTIAKILTLITEKSKAPSKGSEGS